jgi:serine/threonine/tyrosine-interacting protein
MSAFTGSEWSYEMRRDMQQIIPGLFIGPHVITRSKDYLQSKGITHILCLRDPKEEQ